MAKPFPDTGIINFDVEFIAKGTLPNGTSQEFKLTILVAQQRERISLADLGTYLQREVYECLRILAANLQETPNDRQA